MANKVWTRKALSSRTRNIENRMAKLRKRVRKDQVDRKKSEKKLRSRFEDNRKLRRRTLRLRKRIGGLEKADDKLGRRTARLRKTVRVLRKADGKLDRRTSRLRRRVAGLEKNDDRLNRRTSRLRKRIKSLRDTDSRLEKRTARLGNRVRDLEKDDRKTTRRISRLRKNVKALRKSDGRVERTTTRLTKVTAGLSKTTDKLKKRTSRLRDDIQGLEKTDNKLKRRAKRLKERIGSLETADRKFKGRISRLEKSNESLEKSGKKMQGKWKALKSRLEDLASRIDDLGSGTETPPSSGLSGIPSPDAANLERRTARLETLAEESSVPALREELQKFEGDNLDLVCRLDAVEANAGALTRRTEDLEDTTDSLVARTARLELLVEPETEAGSPIQADVKTADKPETEPRTEPAVTEKAGNKLQEIDLAVQRLDEQAANHDENIAKLAADHSDQKEKLSLAEAKVADLTGEVEGFHERAAQISGIVTALEAKSDVDKQRVSDLSSTLDELKSLESRLSGRAEELNERMQGLEVRIDSQSAKIEALDESRQGSTEDVSASVEKLAEEARSLAADNGRQDEHIERLSGSSRWQAIVGGLALLGLLLGLFWSHTMTGSRITSGQQVTTEKIHSIEKRLSDLPDQGGREILMASLSELRGSLDKIRGRVEKGDDNSESRATPENTLMSGQILRLREKVEQNEAMIRESSNRMQGEIASLDERLSDLQRETAELKGAIIPIGGQGSLARWENARKLNMYSIQLVAVLKKQSMLSFIDRNDLYENTAYLQSVNQDQQWFVLLYGIYTSFSEAKTALENLPPDLQEYGPWIRPLGERANAYPLPKG